jgi:hypothetical protein
MRCKTGDGETWTTVRVKEMRERLGLAEYGGSTRTEETMIAGYRDPSLRGKTGDSNPRPPALLPTTSPL